jgi:hypothetical protein
VGPERHARIVARARALWRSYGSPAGCEPEFLYQATREFELVDQLCKLRTTEKGRTPAAGRGAEIDVKLSSTRA